MRIHFLFILPVTERRGLDPTLALLCLQPSFCVTDRVRLLILKYQCRPRMSRAIREKSFCARAQVRDMAARANVPQNPVPARQDEPGPQEQRLYGTLSISECGAAENWVVPQALAPRE
jgi:hypothetical protein